MLLRWVETQFKTNLAHFHIKLKVQTRNSQIDYGVSERITNLFDSWSPPQSQTYIKAWQWNFRRKRNIYLIREVTGNSDRNYIENISFYQMLRIRVVDAIITTLINSVVYAADDGRTISVSVNSHTFVNIKE